MACSASGKSIDRLNIFIDKQLYWILNLWHWPCKGPGKEAHIHAHAYAHTHLYISATIKFQQIRHCFAFFSPCCCCYLAGTNEEKCTIKYASIALIVPTAFIVRTINWICLLGCWLLSIHTQCIHNKITHAFHTWPPMDVRFCNALYLLIKMWLLPVIATMTHMRWEWFRSFL